MDPELKQSLIRVFLVGGSIITISVALLFVAFRSFGAEKGPGSELRIVLTLSGAILFILIACLVLMRF